MSANLGDAAGETEKLSAWEVAQYVRIYHYHKDTQVLSKTTRNE